MASTAVYCVSITNYIITKVHSSFSLVENRDLLEDRRTAHAISVTSQSHFKIINSQWRALFCIHRDTSNGVQKSFRCTTKLILANIFQVDNILPLSVQL